MHKFMWFVLLELEGLGLDTHFWPIFEGSILEQSWMAVETWIPFGNDNQKGKSRVELLRERKPTLATVRLSRRWGTRSQIRCAIIRLGCAQ